MMGTGAGWFCQACPTLVMNTDELSEMLGHPRPHWDVGDEFSVLGIVDLDAVPPERSGLPLGDEDNPIPLIPLIELAGEATAAGDGRPRGPAGPVSQRGSSPSRKKAKRRLREAARAGEPGQSAPGAG